MKRRILSSLMALVLVFGLLPVSAMRARLLTDEEKNCFRGVDGHHHMHLVEKPRRALDYIQVSGGNGVIRAGAYCDSHAL